MTGRGESPGRFFAFLDKGFGQKYSAPAVFFPLYLKHKGYILRLINK